MSGIDVLKQLRRRGIKMPIMVLTGENTTETKVVAFAHGADDYLVKPFHRDELVARVHAIVRRAQGHSQSKLQIGDVSLNLDTRQATAAGKIIPLTRREFKMLELLFLHRGRTVTVDMFLSHLYGGMDEPHPEIIKVYVCKLRNRLGAHGAMIEPIYGTGYIVRGPHESLAA
jgi:two-component system cell cycle response regulator CtrA